MFGLIGSFTKLESAIESTIKTNCAIQFQHANPIWKWYHITLTLMRVYLILNEILILVIRVTTINFTVAIFVTNEEVLVK